MITVRRVTKTDWRINMKRIALIFAVLAMLCTSVLLCACGGDGESSKTESSEAESSVAISTPVSESVSESDESEPANAAVFTVTVVDGDGNAVSGVMMQLCKDSCIPAKTDSYGKATFNVEITDGYKLSVLTCPEGYTYEGEAEVYLESGITEYTVELVKGN